MIKRLANLKSTWKGLTLRGRIIYSVVLLVLAALVLGGGYLLLKKTVDPIAAATGPEWYEVEMRSFDQVVSASGELEAKDQVEIKNKVDGTSSIVEVIEEGTFVKGPVLDEQGKVIEPGQLLARLADDKIVEKIEQATLDVEKSRADQVAADQQLAIQISESDNSRRAAEVKLALAELDLSKWKQGDDLQKKQELQLALEKAQRTLVREREDMELSRQLFAENFISKGELDDDELKYIEAQAALQTAKLNISVYENYTHPKEEKKFNSDVDQAKSELQRTIGKNERELARLKADLESKTGQLKIREEILEKLLEQQSYTVIRAPKDGLVVYGTSVGPGWRRRDPIMQGREVRFNETLFVLPDTRQMNAVLKVHEAMMVQVKKGQRVDVSIDARPGTTIRGTVLDMAVTPEDGGWMNPDLREYKVQVELDFRSQAEVLAGLKPSMRCSGRIMVGRVEDVLAVPIQAVVTEGRRNFVHVPYDESKVRRKAVRIGRASESMVEITSGLQEGDRVLLRKPRPGEVVRTGDSSGAAGAAGTGSTGRNAAGNGARGASEPSTNGNRRSSRYAAPSAPPATAPAAAPTTAPQNH